MKAASGGYSTYSSFQDFFSESMKTGCRGWAMSGPWSSPVFRDFFGQAMNMKLAILQKKLEELEGKGGKGEEDKCSALSDRCDQRMQVKVVPVGGVGTAIYDVSACAGIHRQLFQHQQHHQHHRHTQRRTSAGKQSLIARTPQASSASSTNMRQ